MLRPDVRCGPDADIATRSRHVCFAMSLDWANSMVADFRAGHALPGKPPYFVVIDRALRDEGTSYHYAAASEYSEANAHLVGQSARALKSEGVNAITG